MRPILLLLAFVIPLIAAESLYHGSETIIDLDADTFDTAVYNQPKAHFVQFYSSWCGACIGYAPTFKKFARQLSTKHPIVQVAVVNCADDKNMPLCRKQKISGFPTLKYFKYMASSKKDSIECENNKYDLTQLQLEVARYIRADFSRENIPWIESVKEDVAPPKENPAEETQGIAPSMAIDLKQYEMHLEDIQSAVNYMLYKEVPRREIIKGDDLTDLKLWVKTLKKYVPVPSIRHFFAKLGKWLQSKASITAEEWIANLDDIQHSLGYPLPKEIQWKACAGSRTNLRGYTCGLWSLAHSMVANAYNLERNNPNFHARLDLLNPFRLFITKFLSCRECAQNFQLETEKHHMNRISRAKDAVIWLWKVHNDVNNRLSGHPGEDPQYPKRQFPPKELCSVCYDENNNFNKGEIFHFLLDYYTNFKENGSSDN